MYVVLSKGKKKNTYILWGIIWHHRMYDAITEVSENPRSL